MQEIKKTDLFKVPFALLEIVDGLNIRKDLGDIPELAQSIKENGLKVPLRGYRNGDKICVADGHRRYAAMKMLFEDGIEITASVVLETRGTNDEQRIIDMVLTNEGKSLTPLELAEAVRRLIAYEYSEAEIAKKFGKSASYINRLNLLNSAPQKLRNYISDGLVSATHAIDMIKENRVEELIEKVKSGDAIEGQTSSTGELIKDAIVSKSKKVTKKDMEALNSWNEFKKAAVDIDVNKINTRERTIAFNLLTRIMNNELNADQIKSYFLI